MKIRYLLIIAAITVCSSMAVSAQPKAKTPTFTSSYTSLSVGCKTMHGSNGTDDAFLCKGPAGYQIRIYYSAAATHLAAELKGKDTTFPIAMANMDFNEAKVKAEWRLANGKPFALIIRMPKYGDPAEGEYFGKLIGHELVVTGLLGFESLKTSIDTKTTGANALAREAADAEYLAKH